MDCMTMAKTMASKTPAMVPRNALMVLRWTPPRIVKLTSAIKVQVRTVMMIVGAPFKRSGIRIANRQTNVKISPIRDFRPVNRPITTTIIKKIARKIAMIGMRLNS